MAFTPIIHSLGTVGIDINGKAVANSGKVAADFQVWSAILNEGTTSGMVRQRLRKGSRTGGDLSTLSFTLGVKGNYDEGVTFQHKIAFSNFSADIGKTVTINAAIYTVVNNVETFVAEQNVSVFITAPLLQLKLPSPLGVGDEIPHRGEGFVPAEIVEIVIDGKVTAQEVAQGNTTVSDNYSTSFHTDMLTQGTHSVLLRGRTSGRKSSPISFTLGTVTSFNPDMSFFPTTVKQGAPVRIDYTGFQDLERIDVVIGGLVITWNMSGSDGSGSIPAIIMNSAGSIPITLRQANNTSIKVTKTLVVSPLTAGTEKLVIDHVNDAAVNTAVRVTGMYTLDNVGQGGKAVKIDAYSRTFLGDNLIKTFNITTMTSGMFALSANLGSLAPVGDYFYRVTIGTKVGDSNVWKIQAIPPATVTITVNKLGDQFAGNPIQYGGKVLVDGVVTKDANYQVHIKAYVTALGGGNIGDQFDDIDTTTGAFDGQIDIPENLAIDDATGYSTAKVEFFVDYKGTFTGASVIQDIHVRAKPIKVGFKSLVTEPEAVAGNKGDKVTIKAEINNVTGGAAAHIFCYLCDDGTDNPDPIVDMIPASFIVSANTVDGTGLFPQQYTNVFTLQEDIPVDGAKTLKIVTGTWDKVSNKPISIDDIRTIVITQGNIDIGGAIKDWLFWGAVGAGILIAIIVAYKVVVGGSPIKRLTDLAIMKSLRGSSV